MAAAAWKARFRQRVASAERNSGFTGKHMVDAFFLLQAVAAEGAPALDSLNLAAGAAEGAAALESLNLVAGAAEGAAAGARHCIDLAVESLKLAAGAASLAAADMLDARLAGLRGASPNPAQPLSTISDISDTEVRTVLQALSGAYESADEAFHLIKVCSAHLSTLKTLVCFAGMDEIVAGERDLAITAFSRASEVVELFLVQAAYAHELLSAPAPVGN